MTHAELRGDVLEVFGTGAAPDHVALVGARARVAGTVHTGADGWSVTIPLRAARWGGPELPVPAGDYRLEGVTVAPAIPVTLLDTLRISASGDRVRIDAPIDPAYDSGEGQAALERRYAAQTGDVFEDAVFFESFYGRNASCNPLALDAEIARVAPGVTRYWSVVDLSVQVPEGAVPVVEGSPQWWRARGTSRLLIVNDWLRRRYVRRRGQRVLQTWHGTPLKRLALHRPGFDPRRTVAVWRESRRWDALLAQNPYAARILRSAYAFRRSVWVEGYPRDDVLSTGDGAATRAALGIAADERVILFAPTWRDDREHIVDFLDPVRLAEDADAVVLVRGHSRTLLPGEDAHGPRVIDVTGYPDTSQLMLAADALVTDYSSIMFDFSVTGKPMYFLVPDMEHYRGELRGFYFDLAELAPGPLVRTHDELRDALAAEDQAAFAERYRRWRARFNPRDDGSAAERVVARLLDQGWIGG
ncbi:CDP-glycerol glycerophosphotransferase family protein [Microbacterium gorillae]|uniref:CDP-glycerol glycerophosphotransferase family protein n=1 Tax=Microbacterium gorillae TaxID=1231063 RepID=UPI00058C66E8|nr:CDP-glycerol glycerophosphotransferase family protein [Microbacterium gorillae]